jgi:hypothetical protein
MVDDAQNPSMEEIPLHRRQGTMKMAKLALQNLSGAVDDDVRKSSAKDRWSEILLVASSLLLIAAISVPGQPFVKTCAFLVPLAAFAYYIYRRIGIVATFDTRQAYLAWRLLAAAFLFGGTFALFAVYVVADFARTMLHQ